MSLTRSTFTKNNRKQRESVCLYFDLYYVPTFHVDFLISFHEHFVGEFAFFIFILSFNMKFRSFANLVRDIVSPKISYSPDFRNRHFSYCVAVISLDVGEVN